ncbi:MAG: SdpI family protein [Sciscionella sp.]
MTDSAPLLLRLILLVVFVVLGTLQATVGYRGLRGELPRDGRAGVRTTATMRDDAAFAMANRIAGPPIMVGGLVAVAGGLLQFFVHGTAATILTCVIALVGMVSISVAGGLHGHRVAATMPAADPAPEASGCGGCACGSAACAAAALG